MSTKSRHARKHQADLDQTILLIEQGQHEQALELIAPIAHELSGSEGFQLWAHSLQALGRTVEAHAVILQGAAKWQTDRELNLHAALLYLDRDEPAPALACFQHAFRLVRGEPEYLARYAYALFLAGRLPEARKHAEAAFRSKGRGTPALVFGLVALQGGDFAAAEDALLRAANSLDSGDRHTAERLLALARFFRGDLPGALVQLQRLQAAGALDADLLPYLAIAAASAGDEASARGALDQLPDPDAPAARLARARVALTLGHPAEALGVLEESAEPPPELAPLLFLTRGRALRLLGRHPEAVAVLEPLSIPGRGSEPLAAMALTDLGRIASDAGEHEQAALRFGRALALDPRNEDASKGLELARQRTAWKVSLAADAEGQIKAARAEADSMRRAFADRERELALLKARLAQVEKAASESGRQAQEAAEEASRAREQTVAQELAARDAESGDRAMEFLRQAFGESWTRCPAPLADALRVAESTYQKALYTELHPAAVAVLYAGALERALYQLLVQPFDRSLTPQSRAAFLQGAVRELRPGRVEYFDRFVESFDPARKVYAPSLGEIARALARRHEPQLSAFGAFLQARFALDDAFFDALAAAVKDAKEKLRDPVAHGRALELPQGELTRLRKTMLLEFAGHSRGALPAMVGAQRESGV